MNDHNIEQGPLHGHARTQESRGRLCGWKGNLDVHSEVAFLGYQNGVWEELPKRGLDQPKHWFEIPPSSVRLILVEGLTEQVLSNFAPYLDEEFFRFHYLDGLPHDQPQLMPRGCFFAKWSRPVLQGHEQRTIENRIASKQPYNREGLKDPSKYGIDYERYARQPRIYRPYDPLEPCPEPPHTSLSDLGKSFPSLWRAANECISFWFQPLGEGHIGILVFDAPRQHVVIEHKYKLTQPGGGKEVASSRSDCFEEYMSSCRRFKAELYRQSQGRFHSSGQVEDMVRSLLLRFVLDDTLEVFSQFRDALDLVDYKMSSDDDLQRFLQNWRDFFGRWRNGLSRYERSISYIQRVTRFQQTYGIEDTKEMQEEKRPTLPHQCEFESLGQEVESLKKHVDSTFQALTSTTAILESRKAIAQAESISKLTNLAFFFIPLTFVSTVFGMNIVEFGGKLKGWIWAAVSTGVTLVTYLILFREDILGILRRSPAYVQRLRMQNVLRKFLVWGLFLAYYLGEVAGFLASVGTSIVVAFGVAAVLGGVGVGIWALATKASRDVKIGVGLTLGATLCFALFSFIPLFILRRRQKQFLRWYGK